VMPKLESLKMTLTQASRNYVHFAALIVGTLEKHTYIERYKDCNMSSAEIIYVLVTIFRGGIICT